MRYFAEDYGRFIAFLWFYAFVICFLFDIPLVLYWLAYGIFAFWWIFFVRVDNTDGKNAKYPAEDSGGTPSW